MKHLILQSELKISIKSKRGYIERAFTVSPRELSLENLAHVRIVPG